MRSLLEDGFNRSEVCRELGIHRSTFYEWLNTNWAMRMDVEEAEERGADRRRYRRWLNHPFRGSRPPRQDGQTSARAYPKPFGAGKSMPPKRSRNHPVISIP